MPDFEILIATEAVARTGAAAVQRRWLPKERGQIAPDPAPDSDRVPFSDHISLQDLWEVLTGQDAPSDFIEEFERVFEGSKDGPWVERLPQALVDRLAALTPEQVGAVAEAWTKTETFHGYNPGLPPEPILAGLTRLFRRDKQEIQQRREAAKVREVGEMLTRLVVLVQRAKLSDKDVYLCSWL